MPCPRPRRLPRTRCARRSPAGGRTAPAGPRLPAGRPRASASRRVARRRAWALMLAVPHWRLWALAFEPMPTASDSEIPAPTDSQRRAIEHRGGPLLLVGAAGSGRTETIARRLAALADDG